MNEWILICNSKYFNLKKAFETEATVTWPLEDKMLVGDVAYFYVTNPYRTILYKCEVTDTNLYGSMSRLWTQKVELFSPYLIARRDVF